MRVKRPDKTGFQHVYGPVPSRRLGSSLGIDLVPFKTCTYDCIYCQLGRTTHKTIERKEYVAAEEILSELERKLADGPVPDYISLVGSGEPTLNVCIGDIIDKIKALTRIPVAVITNGSLLWMPTVRHALMNVDLVLPSLDAGDQPTFQAVNRPRREIPFDRMVNGLVGFTGWFPGHVWLEVFLLDGITGSLSEVKKIADLVGRIHPEKVQLNTVTRPAAETYASPISRTVLESYVDLFGPNAETITDKSATVSLYDGSPTLEDIKGILLRHPCNVEDLAEGLNIQPIVAVKQLEILMNAGKVKEIIGNGGRFYVLSQKQKHRI